MGHRFASVLALAAASLVPAYAQNAPRRGGTLDIAVIGSPPTLDCHASNSFATIFYVAPHYSSLVQFDQDHYPEVRGDLAESWTSSTDGTVWTFKLRSGITFHDGSALTARDVKASFDRLRDPPAGVVSVRKGSFGNIDAIEASEMDKVSFRLKRPDQSFLNLLANPFNCVYSAEKLAKDPTFPAQNVLGTGPFVFVEHVPGSHWTGRRNDKYFMSGLPYLDGFKAVTMTNAALLPAIESGNVMADFRGINPVQQERLRRAVGEKIVFQQTTRALSLLVGVNTERKPLDDPRVRQALNLAIDRWQGGQALGKISLARYPGGILPPGSPTAATEQELVKLPGLSRDIDTARAEARRLLQEAGVPNLKLTLTGRDVDDPYGSTGIFLIDQWRRIGVTVEHLRPDTGAWANALSSGSFDLILDFTVESFGAPEVELAKYISRDRSTLNPSRYIDRDLDALYDRIVATNDAGTRHDLVRRFEERVLKQAYFLPLQWWNRTIVEAAFVKGYKVTPSQHANNDLARIWLDR